MTYTSLPDIAKHAWAQQSPFIVTGRMSVENHAGRYKCTVNGVPAGVSYVTPRVARKLFYLQQPGAYLDVHILVLPALGENIVID